MIRTIISEQKQKCRRTLTTRGGRGRGGVGGAGRGMYDMCMCANLYKYHDKKHDVAAPVVKRRK